ncbi:SMAD/FHA domain-containing protein [Lichtheimia hyalospora FSU 10163]|nr:SMAD/FHA domain-containing protein [Lichtheimia hyalospora FSU 10163]
MATTSTSTCRHSNNDAYHDEPTADIATTATSHYSTSSSTNNCDTNIHIRIVPSIDDPNRCFIFNIFERDLKPGNVIKMGRFADHHLNDEHISLRSKVVSRMHCELWLEHNGKLYLRDTKSSSGTYVNHMRLTSTQQASRPVEIHDGDLVQLGVDYQDGMEPCYRAVKMRFEINRTTRAATYNAAAFHNLKTLTNSTQVSEQHPTSMSEEDDCCICLYTLKPAQALFVAPCSHSFHFKCIRPLLASYPGFQCPMCRSYSDLRDNEAEDKIVVVEQEQRQQQQHQPLASPRTSNVGSSDIQRPNATASLTLATSVTHMSGMDTAANHHEGMSIMMLYQP